MASSGSSPDSGQRIGAYEVQRLLGRGGMGEVFLAWDARLRRQVAIKRVRSDRGLDTPSRQRLLREARAVAGLSHPAIVHVYDLIEDAGAGDCIVMEYVEGRTLTAEIGGGLLEPARAIRLGHEIAEGLTAAHAAGIVHRDLKSENVIVTVSGHAKILDFGLALPQTLAVGESRLTQDGVLLGTFHMMSPEQASGGDTDERSDLFSLGAMLYEMLTGISPFHGASPSETLKRVLFDHPARVDAVRPGLPARLCTLVERLLAKEPGNRPASAAEVARELGEIAAFLSSASIPTRSASVSDLPTVAAILSPAAARPVSRQPGAPGSTAGMSVLRRRGMKRAAAALLAVVVLGIAAFLVTRPSLVRPSAPPLSQPPLRVVVLQPQIHGDDDHLRLAASGVLAASFKVLSSLEGVDAIDQPNLIGKPVTLPEIAQAAAANELLVATIESSGERGKITLRRQTPGNRLLWTETLLVPIEPDHLLDLASVVDASLLRGYKDRQVRPGIPASEARTEDYTRFIAVKQRLDTGTVPSEEDFNQLQRVMNTSPKLLEARLLAIQVQLGRFDANHRVEDLDDALDLVKGALELAPDDPNPLLLRFKIELARSQTQPAARTLKHIEQILPRDPRVLVLRSKLADREGRLDEALADLRKAVQTSPTWPNLSSLADLESRTGHVEEARGHLRQILAASPHNIFALNGLARIELLFGDLQEAEKRYQELLALTPKPLRAHYTNLGVTRILLERYPEAIAVLHKALEIDPDSTSVNLNLAQAELAVGDRRDSQTHFQNALREIEKNPFPGNELTRAECLAFLGRSLEAVKIIDQVPEQKRNDPEFLKSAALVYAVTGNPTLALANVEKAIDKGVQSRWFYLPGYASLRRSPDFQDILRKAPGPLGEPPMHRN